MALCVDTLAVRSANDRTRVEGNVAQHEASDRQRDALRVIVEFVRTHGYPPTVREIGEALGISSSASVQSLLSALERKQYVARPVGKVRAITVLRQPFAA